MVYIHHLLVIQRSLVSLLHMATATLTGLSLNIFVRLIVNAVGDDMTVRSPFCVPNHTPVDLSVMLCVAYLPAHRFRTYLEALGTHSHLSVTQV